MMQNSVAAVEWLENHWDHFQPVPAYTPLLALFDDEQYPNMTAWISIEEVR